MYQIARCISAEQYALILHFTRWYVCDIVTRYFQLLETALCVIPTFVKDLKSSDCEENA